jgi:hypothetical protein
VVWDDNAFAQVVDDEKLSHRRAAEEDVRQHTVESVSERRGVAVSAAGVLTVVRLDGVPIALIARTPPGQFLGAVQLTVSADGTPVVESINAQ